MTPQKQRYTITALCAHIQAAAIQCDHLHVFCSYSPHVDSLSVYAQSVDTDYDDPEPEVVRVIDKTVYLDDDSAGDQLLTLVGEMKSVGVVV